MSGKLSARKIAIIREPGRYGDGDGLWLHVGRGAGRSWIFRYTWLGRQAEMGLGSLDVLSLAEARDSARLARRRVSQGVNPKDARDADLAAMQTPPTSVSFSQAAERFIAANEAAWRNPKHRQQWRNTLATYVEPVFGDAPVEAIDTDLVMRVLEPIWTKKPETASRVRGRIESVLDWAKARGLREGENPARWRGHLKNLLPQTSKVARVRHHRAVPWRDMPNLMARLSKVRGMGASALRFAIYTAARSGEVRGARWSEIDVDAAEWCVPGERMKAGKPHRVPLSSAALVELETVRPLAEGPDGLVFPSNRPGRPISDMTLAAVLRRLEVDGTPHGMRSAFRDWAAEATGHPAEAAEMALAHVVSSAVERAYRRGDLFERRRRLMEDWAAHCEGGAEGESVFVLRGPGR